MRGRGAQPPKKILEHRHMYTCVWWPTQLPACSVPVCPWPALALGMRGRPGCGGGGVYAARAHPGLMHAPRCGAGVRASCMPNPSWARSNQQQAWHAGCGLPAALAVWGLRRLPACFLSGPGPAALRMDARCKMNGYVYVCVLCCRKCMVHVCVLSVISYNLASTDAGLITERISRSTVST